MDSRARCWLRVALAFGVTWLVSGGVSSASAAGQLSPSPMSMTTPAARLPAGVSSAELQRIEQIVSDQTHASPETSAQWSVFNHKAAGVFVLLWGLTAFIVGLTWPRLTWFRFAPPLVMLGLAEFLFIRNDPKAWPAGPIGFWISWQDPETAQHRIFVLLIIAIAVVELLRAADRLPPLMRKFALPGLVAITAVLLLFHQHGGLAMQMTMQRMGTAATAPSAAQTGMNASMTLIKHEHLVFALFGFGLGAARLLADLGVLKGRLGAMLWPLFAVGLGVYMFGYYSE